MKYLLPLNEYLTNQVGYLMKYFNQTDKEKMESLPFEYIFFTKDFIDEEGIELPEDIYELYDDELCEYLKRNEPEIFQKFGEWLFNKIQNDKLPVDFSEYPSWYFFEPNPELIKNQWLIHFTNDANSIAKSGFIYGTDNPDRLGLTTHLSDYDKKYGGYNFAYSLKDYMKYGFHRLNELKYGKEAVVFRASGIKLYHIGDEEPQVIFYGNTARDIVPITGGYQYLYNIRNYKNGNLIYGSDELDKVVEWITKNFEQYRKIIIKN